jgi:dipeptidyl aminopeptidase/acylaminoacyl peptidase
MLSANRWWLPTVVGVALMLAEPAAAQQPFTLRQVLSAPFPAQPVADPGGNRVAWVQNAEGVRNIWVAEAPDYRSRQLTAYDADDGQGLSGLAFTPDGLSIVYVRGGAPNRQGEIPNPLSEPDGAERAIWVVPVAGGEPRKLAVGSSPVVSSRGDVVAFLKRGQVWSVALGDSAKAEQLFEIRGNAGALRWSPDGSMLAFMSSRGDHGFLGVFHLADRWLRYLDPSVDRVSSPVWSPEGDRIAHLRVPNQRAALPFMPRREAEPWSIRVVTVATGEGREVWRAAEGPGSALRGLSGPDLMWGAGDHLVFPWERDGWTHLCSVPVGGGEATLLTPGDFETQHVALSVDRRHVVFSSNQDDIDRRHLWMVPVSGGRPQALTSGSGIEWGPAPLNGGGLAFLASDARTPAHAEILRDGRREPLAPTTVPDDFPSRHLVEPQQVIFPAADGMPIHGQLFLPPGAGRGERHPAVLFFHGGSRRQMLLGFHYRGYYHSAYALNQYLASRGYVVLSVNYRSGIGYGMEFREALNYGARGATEFNDVMGAGLYLASRPEVDRARVGLWGGSYGGYLTALGLARASDLFAAGVDLHGVHDWNQVIRNFVPAYQAEQRVEVARLAFESSPMASLDTWRSPVLVIHGDDDRNVPFSETVDLVERLRARGVEVEQLIFPDEVHGFLLHRNWMAAYGAAAEFFDRKLRP